MTLTRAAVYTRISLDHAAIEKVQARFTDIDKHLAARRGGAALGAVAGAADPQPRSWTPT